MVQKSNPDAGVFIHAGIGSSSIICPRIESTSENKIKYYHRNGNTNNEPASELSFDLNEWNSVAYVVDGNSGSIKVYLNGMNDPASTASFDVTESYYTSDRSWQMGAITWQGAHWMEGQMENTSIWDYALSEQEIVDYTSTTLSGNEQGLLALWKYNAGTGDILYDHSGNANHGIIYGADWIPVLPNYSGPNWYVSNNGSDDNNGSLDYPFATIQAGINASSNGHSVIVLPGTYNGNNIINGNITVVSLSGPDSTIINCNGYAFTITSSPRISGFKFSGSSNYGIYIDGNGSPSPNPEIWNNQFINCNANESNDYAVITGFNDIFFSVKNCLFYGNGQRYLIGTQGTGLIENCTFYGNFNGGDTYSGLFETSGGTTIIRNSIIRDNQNNSLSGNYTIEYSNLDFIHNFGEGNFDSNPLFLQCVFLKFYFI